MVKASRTKIASGNEVTRRLSKGSGNIKGIKLCANVDDVALIPVVVIGVSFSDGTYRTGVHVTVEPVGGHGQLTLDPLSLIDDTAESHDLFRRKAECSRLCQEFGALRCDRQRRTELLNLRSSLSEKQKSAFDATAEDRFGKGTDMVKAINKAGGEYEFKRLFIDCAKLKLDLVDVGQLEDFA